MSSNGSAASRRLLDEIGSVDAVGIEERVAKFATRSIKKSSKVFGLKLAVSMVDLTTLEGKDTPGKVASLCVKALNPHVSPEEGRTLDALPSVAAVCVYPAMVRHARRHLGKSSPVRIASVATAFPSGQSPLKTRLAEVRAAVVRWCRRNRHGHQPGGVSRRRIRAGSGTRSARSSTPAEPARSRSSWRQGSLRPYDNIRAASFLAMRVIRPGDFIKTSTGKTSSNATLGNNQVMLEAIRDHYLDTGVAIGMKPAGGIRTAKQALGISGRRDRKRSATPGSRPRATASAHPPCSTICSGSC
jgi:deoxyribose-phosphate aldolase